MRHNSKTQNGKYFLLPNCIFQQDLLPRDLSVYCCLKYHSGDDFTCFPSRKTIARECKMSLPTVDKALGTLEDKGLVTITRRYNPDNGNRNSHIYRIQQPS